MYSCIVWLKTILPIPFQFYAFYFFLLSYCTVQILQKNELVKAETFVFVLVLESIQYFLGNIMLVVGFSWYPLSDWDSFFLFLVFWEFFSRTDVTFCHFFLPASFGMIVCFFFFLLLIWGISLIYFQMWNKPSIVLVVKYYYNYLIMMYHFLMYLLDSICQYFL